MPLLCLTYDDHDSLSPSSLTPSGQKWVAFVFFKSKTLVGSEQHVSHFTFDPLLEYWCVHSNYYAGTETESESWNSWLVGPQVGRSCYLGMKYRSTIFKLVHKRAMADVHSEEVQTTWWSGRSPSSGGAFQSLVCGFTAWRITHWTFRP